MKTSTVLILARQIAKEYSLRPRVTLTEALETFESIATRTRTKAQAIELLKTEFFGFIND